MKAGTFLTPISRLLAGGLLVLAGVFSGAHPAFAQTQLECPLPAGVTPPAPPRVTAQQVEDGSASLMDFTLAVRDQFVNEFQGATTLDQTAYFGCLFRQEGSPWRSGSTYIVELTPDGRVFIHTKDMSLSGRLLTPVIYGAILHALGISPADLADPAAALAAFAAAVAGDGGPFNVPDVPGASGYATVYGIQSPRVLLAGFDLSESHLVPIRDDDIDYGDPSITAREVVDRATLKAFVTAAGEYVVELLGSGDLAALSKARVALRDPDGPWRHGSVYLFVMDSSGYTSFHGAFPDKYEFQTPTATLKDQVTGKLVLPQLIEAAKSSPEGGFVQYYFDDPNDDTDRADIPKVGYARQFSGPPIDFIIGSGFYQSSGGGAVPVGVLENPGPHSFQSGTGMVWGWVCEAEFVEIEIETAQGEVESYRAAYRMERLDTQERCGDVDNGFEMLFNWNRLGDGEHRVTAFVDGLELGRATVRVKTLGEEVLQGVVGECVAENFPHMGQNTRLEWQQTNQNFVITEVQ